MAPRNMQQQQQPKMKKNAKKVKKQQQVKAEIGKIREAQKCIKEEQRKIRGRFGEIERQCTELKQEAEMIAKQSASTHIKLFLMFKILKAREGGCLNQAATLTHLLREFVAKQRANDGCSQIKHHPWR